MTGGRENGCGESLPAGYWECAFRVFLAVGKLSYLFQTILNLKAYLPMDSSYVETLLKMVGIAYIGEFSSGICKDAGYGAIGGQIELFSKLAIMAVSMPIMLALMETIHGFLS